jgi:MFS transporter, ACS family, hexuronate transporter
VAMVGGAPVSAFFLLWGAKYLVEVAGTPAADVGRYLWLPPLMLDLGAIAFGDLASRAANRPERRGAHRALFGVAALLASMAAAVSATRDPWAIAALAGLSMAGGAGMVTLLMTEMLRQLPPELVSRAAGFTGAAQSLAYVVASPIIGRVVASRGYLPVLVGLGAWVLACAAYWLARTASTRAPAPDGVTTAGA